MEKTEIQKKVNQLINDLLGENEDYTIDQLLGDDIGLDSLDKVELTMNAEKEFNTIIDDLEVEKAKTVGDFIDIIQKQIK